MRIVRGNACGIATGARRVPVGLCIRRRGLVYVCRTLATEVLGSRIHRFALVGGSRNRRLQRREFGLEALRLSRSHHGDASGCSALVFIVPGYFKPREYERPVMQPAGVRSSKAATTALVIVREIKTRNRPFEKPGLLLSGGVLR